MDITMPELVWVEGRCYRFCDKYAWSQGENLGSYQEETYEPDCALSDDEACDSEINVEPAAGNRYKHSFYVNSNFFRYIIGAKGTTLKRMQSDTRTTIIVPKIGVKGDVVVIGTNRRDVVTARHRIDILIETARSKLEFTHFISIPCQSDELKENYDNFKKEIIKNCGKGPRPITEDMFQRYEKLHLTICMLVLLDEKDRNKATEALKSCENSFAKTDLKRPLRIEFRGVEIMNDDPSEVDILYIKAHDVTGQFQKIANEIYDSFVNEGLTRRQYDKVKLHMTAINTKFLSKRDEHGNYPNFKQKEKFNALYTLKNYNDTYFGKIDINSIHISQRHLKSEDGYYALTAKIEF